MEIKKKKILKIILIVWIVVIAVFTFIDFAIGNDRKVQLDTNINNYGKFNYSDLYLGETYSDLKLVIFPESIENNKVINYKNLKVTQGFNTVGINIFIVVEYSESLYNQEIQRLENSSRPYGEKTIKFLVDEAIKFNNKTYIATYNTFYSFEYATLLGENKIAYVYLSRVQKDEMLMPEEYLPKDYYGLLDLKGEETLNPINKFSFYYDLYCEGIVG